MKQFAEEFFAVMPDGKTIRVEDSHGVRSARSIDEVRARLRVKVQADIAIIFMHRELGRGGRKGIA